MSVRKRAFSVHNRVGKKLLPRQQRGFSFAIRRTPHHITISFQMLLPLILLSTVALVQGNVQCYVGQKLFSYEANNAVCAKFVPYACTQQCEWKKSCSEHIAYGAFKGRRTFVSGLLINQNSLMVLCCASMATRVETDSAGREKCVWRDSESLPVVGPSLRTNPVLAPNHYIREIRMERDGTSRVDATIEVCQYVQEFEHCNVAEMTDAEKRRYNLIQLKLQRYNATLNSNLHKADDADKNSAPLGSSGVCNLSATTECGKSVQSQLTTCCKDQSACDRACLKGVEQTLQFELVHHQKGCTTQEVRQGLDCLSRQVNNLS